MAILPHIENPPPGRSLRIWTPGKGWTTANVSGFATNPTVAGNQPQPRPVIGNDVQTVTIHIAAIAGSSGQQFTGSVTFPNIPPFKPNHQDQALFHVYPVHHPQLPAGVAYQGLEIRPRASQNLGGPSLTGGFTSPSAPLDLVGGLSPGITYQGFSADIIVTGLNTQLVNSIGTDVVFVFGAHIINRTG